MDEQRRDRLNDLLATVRRRHGDTALILGSRGWVHRGDALLPSGFPAVDAALDGGLPCGALIELAGRPTSGATTLALAILAHAQQQGRRTVYLDLHGTFDPQTAVAHGLRLADLLLLTPPHPTAALSLLEALVQINAGVLLVDDTAPWAQSLRPWTAFLSTLARLRLTMHSSGTTVLLRNRQQGHDLFMPLAALRLLVTRERWLAPHQRISGYVARVTVNKHPQRRAVEPVLLPIFLPPEGL